MPNLSTTRLGLRPWQAEDADFVFDMYSRWEVQQFIGAVPRVMEDRSEAVALLERLLKFEHPVHGYWAVERKDTGQLVGTVLLKPIPASGESLPLQPSGDIESGWHFHPDSWGNGFATEAASTVLTHAFDSGLDRVVAVTSPDNAASQQVCLRIGMTDQGLTSKYYNTECELFVVAAQGVISLLATVVKTDRLVLEPVTVNHAAEMVSALADPSLYEFTGGEAPTRAELDARYARQAVGASADGSQRWFNWVIRKVSTGALIGYVQATVNRSGEKAVAEVAWVVAPSAQGRGIASEAAVGMLAWLRSVGVRRFVAHVHPSHGASAAVASRCGMRRTAVIEDGEERWELSDS